MAQLSFNEIHGGGMFEDLVSDYFRVLRDESQLNVTDVIAYQTGIGPDGGTDIILTLEFSDSIQRFERKWIVQCKFHDRNVGKQELASVNIPSLIHEYNANGYLLVCKKNVTDQVSLMFQNLNDNCKFKYSYACWHGNQFLSKIAVKPTLISRYFPQYWRFMQQQEKLNEVTL